jgi:hypothetical protein
MGVGEDFRQFCGNLTVSTRSDIAARCSRITKRLNLDFWGSDSETSHSFYTGSYGRGTAIGLTSDVDVVFQLPYDTYLRFNRHANNGQAALLHEVRKSLKGTYSASDIGRDGCVVVVPFTDGIRFEVQPAFLNQDGSYTFPDSTDGGKWRTTNPKPEIDAIYSMDKATNGNLRNLARMARAWKAVWDVPIGGLLIDTLAYGFIREWPFRDKSFLYYDFISRDFFEFLANQDPSQRYWLSPHANQYVWRSGSFEYKAKQGRNIAVEAIQYASNGSEWSSRRRWRDIYGTAYPG